MRTTLLATIFTLGTSVAATADIAVRFIESAPKDRFEFINTGACALGPVALHLDLSTSAAGLIFDVSGAGAGVEVFQPFELVAGADLLSNTPIVLDGMSALRLDLKSFPVGAKVAFTVDVDDTLDASDLGQIRVSGGEIAGAVVRMDEAEGVFSENAAARLPAVGCSA